MKEKKILYYSDELNDDFAGNNIQTKDVPENFRYVSKNLLFKILTFIVYRIIVTPLVSLYVKIKYHQRFKNKRVLKKAGKQGYFLFCNHTNGDLDAFVPTMATFPKKAYIVANPDVISIRGIRALVMMLGALPLPANLSLYKRFLEAVRTRVSQGQVVTIYPEAHIWPYYTDIRDFNPASLGYAVLFDKPVFCLTNIYTKQRFFKRPKVVTYVDGPFYPDKELKKKENIALLKQQVYGTMKRHVSGHPKFEYKYTYVKKG